LHPKGFQEGSGRYEKASDPRSAKSSFPPDARKRPGHGKGSRYAGGFVLSAMAVRPDRDRKGPVTVAATAWMGSREAPRSGQPDHREAKAIRGKAAPGRRRKRLRSGRMLQGPERRKPGQGGGASLLCGEHRSSQRCRRKGWPAAGSGHSSGACRASDRHLPEGWDGTRSSADPAATRNGAAGASAYRSPGWPLQWRTIGRPSIPVCAGNAVLSRPVRVVVRT
jgi:hypothetical protein